MKAGATLPVQITLRGLAHSEALVGLIREKADKLARFHEHIASCRVTLEVLGKHKQHGTEVQVHVEVKIPGEDIAVTHKHAEDAAVALRDAFDAVRRHLEDAVRRQREKRAPA